MTSSYIIKNKIVDINLTIKFRHIGFLKVGGNKMLRKIKALLIISIVIIFSIAAKASSKDIINDRIYYKNLSKRNDLIVNAIKNGESDFERIIKEQFSYEDLQVPVIEDIKVIRSEELDNVIINFKNDGTFYIEKINIKNDKLRFATDHDAILRGAVSYKTASNSYEARGLFGNLLWEAYIEAEFGFDGQKAWVNGTPYGYYKRGNLSLWQVSDWDVDWTNYGGELGARAYARGNFHWGVEYDGNGLVIQELNLDLRVSCNYKGRIFKNKGV